MNWVTSAMSSVPVVSIAFSRICSEAYIMPAAQ